MKWTVIVDDGAIEDIVRLEKFAAEKDPAWAESCVTAIHAGLNQLSLFPWSFRKAEALNNPLFRELVIPFGSAGYVALYEIRNAREVFVLAVRHQRESDYH